MSVCPTARSACREGLKGIRFTLLGNLRISLMSWRACSGRSFTPRNMVYSKVIDVRGFFCV